MKKSRESNVEKVNKLLSVLDSITDSELLNKLKKEQLSILLDSGIFSAIDSQWLKYDLDLMEECELKSFFKNFNHSERMYSCVVLYTNSDVLKAKQVFQKFDQFEFDYMHDDFFNTDGIAEYNKKFEIRNLPDLLLELYRNGIKIKDYIMYPEEHCCY